MDPFVPRLDLRRVLREVAADGAGFVPRALAEPFRDRLQRAVERGPFGPVPEVIGPVRQETESFAIGPGALPEADRLRRSLAALVRAHGRGIRGLATWRPNDVQAQRYRPGALGITSHLDGRRFRRLIAVFTTAGSARFAVSAERAGPAVAAWEAGPGSLVLLRGPGLAGLRDGRPFHTVSGPTAGYRYSVALRMEARREEEG